MSLRWKATGLFLLITLLPLLISAAIIGFLSSKVLLDQTIEKLNAVANIQEQRINEVLQRYLDQVNLVTSQTQLRTSLAEYTVIHDPRQVAQIEKIIKDAQRSSSALLEITILDLQGQTIASTNVQMLGTNQAAADAFQSGLQTTKLVGVTRDDQDLLVVQLSGPLILENRVIGVAEILTSADPLIAVSEDTNGLGETGEVLLATKNQTGDALFITPLRYDAGAALRRAVSQELTQVPITRAVKGEELVLTSPDTVDYGGRPVIAVTKYIESLDWGLMAKIDRQEVFAPIRQVTILSSVIAAIVAGVVILIAIWVTGWFVQPIKELMAVSQAIAQGNLGKRIPISSKDELGQLAHVFNQMTSKLISSQHDVAGKSQALEQANAKVSEGWFKIQKEKARLMTSIDNLPIGVVMTDEQCKILMTNQAVGKILGLDPSHSLEQRLNEIFDFRKFCQQSSQQKQLVGPDEVIYQNKYLKVMSAPVLTSLAQEPDSPGVSGTVVLIEDITEHKLLEQAKDELFAMASHELRTPLTAIKGNISNLEQIYQNQLKDDHDLQEIVGDIKLASDRMLEMVNDYLDMSRLELGKMTFELQAVNLPQIAAEVVRELAGVVEQKQLYLRLEVEDKALPLASADEKKTKEILVNLIGNALKFTTQGGITIKLEELKSNPPAGGAEEPSSETSEKSILKVTVIDTGEGIPEDKQAVLFKKYQQIKAKKTEVAVGTGLGLYISKLLVEGMRGKIYLESSEVGKGSTFAFTLPVAK